MFQVASHPTHFTGAHMHSQSHSSSHRSSHFSSPAAVQLPRTLARPPFAEVSREAIASAAPELANAPPLFTRTYLRDKVPQMHAGIAALAPSHLPSTLSRSHLPKSLTIPLHAPPSSQCFFPTHILAISYSKPSSPSMSAEAKLFPVHSLVVASNCAHFPPLPSRPHPAPGRTLELPVIPLSLPSPHAFSILHSFMYTHRLDDVLAALLPLPSAFLRGLTHAAVQSTLASGPRLHDLSNHLCASSGANLQKLTTHAGHVKELWQDCVTLGLHDPELWDAIDLAWEIVLGALNLAAAGH